MRDVANMKPDQIPLLGWIGMAGLMMSFFYPGLRIENFPVYVPLLFSAFFAHRLLSSYNARRMTVIAACFFVIIGGFLYNTLFGYFELRDWAYLNLPVGAVLATAMVGYVAENVGMERVIKIALIGSLVNLAVMLAQSVNLLSIVTVFAAVWENAINFVSYDEYQSQVLWATLSIRPPGFFATGIFSSTIIYISLRAHYAIYRNHIVFIPIVLALVITANRTLAAFFVAFEAYRLIVDKGLSRFLVVASIAAIGVAAGIFILIEFDIRLYVIDFIFDELMSGGLSQSDSITGRLNTYDFFMFSLPKYWLIGGFSSADLAYYGGVFDSEIMLRTLQFGIPSGLAIATIALLPRCPGASVDWWFLPAIALAASLTTTLVTSVVYMIALAIYREAVLYRAEPAPAPGSSTPAPVMAAA